MGILQLIQKKGCVAVLLGAESGTGKGQSSRVT
jgi:hypothetical protein